MLEDSREAMTFAEQVGSFEEFSQNALYRKAIVMSIINIGELTKRLPDDFKREHPEIPWRKISGMRDMAAHGYHIINDDIVWDVVNNYIPELAAFTEKHIESKNI
jgi:uncharacterized protein with HEPN domain